jgi:hypothetical protein
MRTQEKQKQHARILIKYLDESGLAIPLQIGIMCVVGKESGFIPKAERSYKNTNNDRLRKLFSRVRGMSDFTLDILKRNDEKFFDKIYGGKLGNRQGTFDAWNYRGAGFNQITGRKMHQHYKTFSEKLKYPEEASRVCVEYFLDRVGSPRIKQRYGDPSKWDYTTCLWVACNINAGIGYGKDHTVVQRAYLHASKWYDFCLDVFWEVEGE